jgi:hypothetical protein
VGQLSLMSGSIFERCVHTALAVERSEEWVTGRRYLDMEELRELRCRESESEEVLAIER